MFGFARMFNRAPAPKRTLPKPKIHFDAFAGEWTWAPLGGLSLGEVTALIMFCDKMNARRGIFPRQGRVVEYRA